MRIEGSTVMDSQNGEATRAPICSDISQLGKTTTPPDLVVGFPSLTTEIQNGSFESKFKVESELGRGKFAVVKLCRDRASDREFAAKVQRKRRKGVDCRKDILSEAAVLQLTRHHPCFVGLVDVYESSTDITLITDYAQGGELCNYLITEGSVSERETVRILSQVLNALIFLHDRCIVHMDIKPQNILLTGPLPGGDVKLCDLGLARYVDSSVSVREIIGTPDYVAPEVLSYEPLQTACDIWSVGVLAYVMLSGCSPFAGDTKQETFLNISQVRLDFPAELFESISTVAEDFIRLLLVREPSERLTARQCLLHVWLSQTEHQEQQQLLQQNPEDKCETAELTSLESSNSDISETLSSSSSSSSPALSAKSSSSSTPTSSAISSSVSVVLPPLSSASVHIETPLVSTSSASSSSIFSSLISDSLLADNNAVSQYVTPLCSVVKATTACTHTVKAVDFKNLSSDAKNRENLLIEENCCKNDLPAEGGIAEKDQLVTKSDESSHKFSSRDIPTEDMFVECFNKGTTKWKGKSMFRDDFWIGKEFCGDALFARRGFKDEDSLTRSCPSTVDKVRPGSTSPLEDGHKPIKRHKLSFASSMPEHAFLDRHSMDYVEELKENILPAGRDDSSLFSGIRARVKVRRAQSWRTAGSQNPGGKRSLCPRPLTHPCASSLPRITK